MQIVVLQLCHLLLRHEYSFCLWKFAKSFFNSLSILSCPIFISNINAISQKVPILQESPHLWFLVKLLSYVCQSLLSMHSMHLRNIAICFSFWFQAPQASSQSTWYRLKGFCLPFALDILEQTQGSCIDRHNTSSVQLVIRLERYV